MTGQVTYNGECRQCVSIHNGTEETMPHMASTFEEADLRILLHVKDCAKSGYSKYIILSSDADVIVALLHHMLVFAGHGLQELWFRAGVRDRTRYLPLPTLHNSLGQPLTGVLPALYSLLNISIYL